jgi:hypothetical protein
MDARRERSLRAMLAGSLVFWGLAAVSVSTVTALTTETAAASSTTFFSSTTPGTYTVTGLPSGIPLTITAVGGSGGADAPIGFAGGEGAIVTSTFTPTGIGESLEVTVDANGGASGPGGAGAGTGGSGTGSTGATGGGGGGSAVFFISTISLPSATPGKPYGPVTLHAANIGASTSPHTTKVTWAGIELPPGLKMSSAGVLSGTPSTNLIPGVLLVVAYATETVTTVSGRKVKTKKTTTQGTIPITIE